MSLPLIVNNSLFWNYKGTILSSWYLCGDGSTADMRKAHLEWCGKYGCDTVVLCMNNEDIMSLFRDGYMRTFDDNKVNIFAEYIFQIHSLGGKVVLAFFDGPAIPNGKYHPILECMDRHEAFIKIVVTACNPYVAAYLIGCETNRYFSTEIVEAAIAITKQYCGDKPVGTHEQWNPDARRWASNADFICYETRNHPKDGDSRSAMDFVNEIKGIQAKLPPGYPVWVCEWNWNAASATSRAQARAMAALPGVVGIGGPF